MKAIRIHENGGPEVLKYEEAPQPEPGPGQVLIKIHASGVNYIDTYHRNGLYPVNFPFTPGMEGSGVVAALGAGVTTFVPGDRVAYCMQAGSYAEYALVPDWKLVRIPAYVGLDTAAAVILQGMTAHYLTHNTYPIQRGDTVLIHAAAGGTGLLLVQIAKKRGARVIGTTSTAEKAALAKENGADEIILYTEQDFAAEVQRLTNGQGVNAVYDSVGQTTFNQSLDCLRPRGYMVLFGQSSGPVGPFNPQILNQKGSLFLARPTLGHYIATPEELKWRSSYLFAWISAGDLKVSVDQRFPLADAANAHRYLEGRKTKGKILLTT